jgi:imidazoleglycerol-phosphate dehydratase
MSARTANLSRKTQETDVSVEINLDGTGRVKAQTGVGFFDHMLDLFGRHALVDLTVTAKGDLHIDAHHTVEDVGIVLGQALAKALGEKRGISRYGWAMVPMDESLAQVAVDFSGRPALVYRTCFSAPMIGEFATELVEEFWKSVVNGAGMNLHIQVPYGTNNHHMAEAIFKATARAVRMAVTVDPRTAGVIPSTKGSL